MGDGSCLIPVQFKGCDPTFEVTIFQILKVRTNETSTLL